MTGPPATVSALTTTGSGGLLLPGGLLLRPCRPGDVAQVGALLAERGDRTDAEDHRLVVEDPDAGPDACAVVVDGDRVVSTATLLDETVRVGDVVLPAARVELVATDPAGCRGAVRAGTRSCTRRCSRH